MKVEIIKVNDAEIAEIIADELIINDVGDALDLMGNLYYQNIDRIILYEKNITPDFFDLQNGMAGEILQKFSNYRVKLAIVGDFSKYTKKSISDFIFESNKHGHINFVHSREEAIEKLTITSS